MQELYVSSQFTREMKEMYLDTDRDLMNPLRGRGRWVSSTNFGLWEPHCKPEAKGASRSQQNGRFDCSVGHEWHRSYRFLAEEIQSKQRKMLLSSWRGVRNQPISENGIDYCPRVSACRMITRFSMPPRRMIKQRGPVSWSVHKKNVACFLLLVRRNLYIGHIIKLLLLGDEDSLWT